MNEFFNCRFKLFKINYGSGCSIFRKGFFNWSESIDNLKEKKQIGLGPHTICYFIYLHQTSFPRSQWKFLKHFWGFLWSPQLTLSPTTVWICYYLGDTWLTWALCLVGWNLTHLILFPGHKPCQKRCKKNNTKYWWWC